MSASGLFTNTFSRGGDQLTLTKRQWRLWWKYQIPPFATPETPANTQRARWSLELAIINLVVGEREELHNFAVEGKKSKSARAAIFNSRLSATGLKD